MSHKQLRRWYRDYNARFFNNRLPAGMQLFYAPSDANHGEAIVDGQGNPSIRIDTCLYGMKWDRMALLHEMNHHDTGDFTHGKKFQAGMLRLANMGALARIW